MSSYNTELDKNNDITISKLDELLEKIGQKPDNFYTMIAEVLSPEEKQYISNNLKNRSCLNCTNGSCAVEYCDKIGFDAEGRPAGYQCLGWMNYELIGRSKVLQISDIKLLK